MYFAENEPITRELHEKARDVLRQGVRSKECCPSCRLEELDQVNAKVFFCRKGCGAVFLKSGNVLKQPGDNEILL